MLHRLNSRLFTALVLAPLVLCVNAVLCVQTTQAQVIVDDDLSTDVNWSVVADADTNVGFGFDYSESGIPPAPNGNDTIGLYTLVNFSDPPEAAAISAVYFDSQLTGQFTVTVDAWNNWFLDLDNNPNNSGTTEFTGLSIGHAGEVPGFEGATFLFTGDGDASVDYRLYKDQEFQDLDTGQYLVDEHLVDESRRDLDHSNPQFTEAFPELDVGQTVPTQGIRGLQRAGAAGFQWITLTAEVDTEAIGVGVTDDPGLVTFKLKTERTGAEITIGRIDNSNGIGDPVELEGGVGLIMNDVFSSVSPSIAHSFGIFDNFKIVRGIGGGNVDPADVDFDGNGVVNTDDIDGLVNEIIAGSNNAAFDLTGDSVVNGSDLDKWLTDAATENGFASAYLSGDANLDGTVDATDLNAVGLNWQQSVSGWTAGDFTADGVVDASDLNDVGLNWQQANAAAAEPAAVPEPGSISLLALASLAFASIARRF